MTEAKFHRTFAERSMVKPITLGEAPLATWLEQPGLSFVIGPGCSRVGSRAPDVLASVARSMARCFAKIGRSEPSPKHDALDRTFLATLAAQKGVDLTMADDTFRDVDPSGPDVALDDARVGLIRAARLAAELLANALDNVTAPILDWDVLHLPTLGLTEESRLLSDTIDGVMDDLDEVDRRINREEVGSLDAADGIAWTDLRVLFGIKNVHQALAGLNERLRKYEPFGGPEVEWLSSLLWHAFRFAASCYPSSHEMAFQLGIGLDQGLAEVPDRPLATQMRSGLGRDDGFERLLVMSARHNEVDGFAPRRNLYRALAQLLLQGHVTRWTKLSAGFDESNPFGEGDNEADPVPLALVSSFDNLLDEALELELRTADPTICRYSTYHLVLPVLLLGAGTDPQADIGWVLGSRDQDRPSEDHLPADTTAEPSWTWELLGPSDQFNQRSGDNTPTPLRLQGPVIIKMHGDPSRAFDPADVQGLREKTDIRPLAVLSEFQHLSVAMAEIELLNRLDNSDLSKGRRRLLLLGESLDEWSIRQRLFGHATWPLRQNLVRRSKESDDSVSEGNTVAEAMAINRHSHPLLHSILSWVRIQPVTGELEDVTPTLARRVGEQRALLANAAEDPAGVTA